MDNPDRARRPSIVSRTISTLSRNRTRSISAGQTKSTLKGASARDTYEPAAAAGGYEPRSRPAPYGTGLSTRENPGLSAPKGRSLLNRPRNLSVHREPPPLPPSDVNGKRPASRKASVSQTTRPKPPGSYLLTKSSRNPSSSSQAGPSTPASPLKPRPAVSVLHAPAQASTSALPSPRIVPNAPTSDDLAHWQEQTDFLRRELYVAERAYGQLRHQGSEAVQLGQALANENSELRRQLAEAQSPLPSSALDLGAVQAILQEFHTTFDTSDEVDPLEMLPPDFGPDSPGLPSAALPHASMVDKALSPRVEEPARIALGISGMPLRPRAGSNRSMLPVPIHRTPSLRTAALGVAPPAKSAASTGITAQSIPAGLQAKPAMVTMATQTETYELCHPDTIFNLEVDNDYYRESNRQLRCRLTNIISKHNALVELILQEKERRQRRRERDSRKGQPASVASTTNPSNHTSAITGSQPSSGLLPSVFDFTRRPSSPLSKPLPDRNSLSGLNTMVAEIEYGMQRLVLKMADSPVHSSHPPPPPYHQMGTQSPRDVKGSSPLRTHHHNQQQQQQHHPRN
ncbi:hypothetical protein BJ085DRAFT_31763 [Dimargaris cristalligena]|uniref:Uncharacterized protein n=1 Tax=Dimargaris cristalligena TaxID=215637 RepID=A0A4P9ZMF0_9FUNG|nr:hypothetical protein BJ085DRAFT_31763 [Dimargaris cristalligena]|eukprot:RKP34544.1 hypothetical protein BJ085DRAFT_31763 [Dimargaris cristalligena]